MHKFRRTRLGRLSVSSLIAVERTGRAVTGFIHAHSVAPSMIGFRPYHRKRIPDLDDTVVEPLAPFDDPHSVVFDAKNWGDHPLETPDRKVCVAGRRSWDSASINKLPQLWSS